MSQRDTEELRIFRHAASILASSLDLDATLANTISACLPSLADFGFFDVVLGEGEVRRTVRAFDDPAIEAVLAPTGWVRNVRTDLNLCALSSGESAFHPDIDDAWYQDVAVNDGHLALLRQLAFRSMISVPLRFGGELLGALTLFMGRSGRRHTPQDLDFAIDIAALAAPIVFNVRMLSRAHAASAAEREQVWRMTRDVLVIASLDGRIKAVNPAFTQSLGWREEEALSTPYLDLVHPVQMDEVQAILAKLARGEAVENFELQTRHAGGGYRLMSWTVVPRGEALYGSGRDVTEERRRNQHALSASEARLQLALEVGRMGAWEWDIASGKVNWWPGMDALHGLPPGSGIERMEDYLTMVHPDDVPMLRQNIAHSFEQGHGSPVTYRIIWPDGSEHWIEGVGDFTLGPDGAPVAMSGICQDISARKREEQDLRFLADVSATLSSVADPEETLSALADLAVQQFADWCAVDLAAGGGRLRRVAISHVDPARAARAWTYFEQHPPGSEHGATLEVLRKGRTLHAASITPEMIRATVSDPEYVAVLENLGISSYIGVPLLAHGRTLGVITFVSARGRRTYTAADVAVAEDIGRRAGIAVENATMYRSLQKADQRKDEFLAMLAHELRNPLAPIRAAADLLRMSRDDRVIETTSGVITRQVTHMTGLVDDLLDVSRVTRGLVVLKRAPLRVETVAVAAIEQVRPLAESRGHRIALLLGREALMVEGDEKRLVQVVTNLLNNAAKYTPPGGDIELRVEGRKRTVELKVRDSGIGMDADLVRTAFELFTQGERSADRALGGLGIGLSLVRSLVELHGGHVSAYSAGPGTGSEFTIVLPRHAPAPAGEGPRAAGQAPAAFRAPMQVMVVDDNVDGAEMLRLVLEAVGHEVTVLNDPLAALEQARAKRFDAFVLDIGLPGMDGNALARHLRALHGEGPYLIAITGYGQDSMREQCRAAGFDHFLVKPVDTDALVASLADRRRKGLSGA